jgi:hypothetical protein
MRRLMEATTALLASAASFLVVASADAQERQAYFGQTHPPAYYPPPGLSGAATSVRKLSISPVLLKNPSR